MEDLKGNALLERVNLVGNQVTEGMYMEPIDGEMDLKGYIELCGREEEMVKYRATLICHIGPSLHCLDGLIVSELELEAALDLEHRGELISFPSAMSSIELIPPSQDTSTELLLRTSPRHVPTNSAVTDVSEAFSVVEGRDIAVKRDGRHWNSIASLEAVEKGEKGRNIEEISMGKREEERKKGENRDLVQKRPIFAVKIAEKSVPIIDKNDEKATYMELKTKYKESRHLAGKESDYYHHYSAFAHSLVPESLPNPRKHHCHCSKHHHKSHKPHSDKENLPQPVKIVREVATSTRQSMDMSASDPIFSEIKPVPQGKRQENRRKGWKLSTETDVSSHKTVSYGEEDLKAVKYPSHKREKRSISTESNSTLLCGNCRTPESSYSSRNMNIEAQLVLYASTPSRPVLTSEAAEPLHCLLSSKGSEFALILQLLQPYGVRSVLKTYTYSQQRAMLGSDRPESTFLTRHSALDKLKMLFYRGEEAVMQRLCRSSLGFMETQDSSQELFFSAHVEDSCKVALMCLVNLGRVSPSNASARETAALRAQGYQSVQLAEDHYLLLDPQCAVPVYLITIASD